MGIYIHVPYCKKACSYCNFHFRIAKKDKTIMLKCINMELEMRKLYLNNKKVDSIYFGGGTPSILTKSEIKCILDTTYNNYNIKEKAEITLECNPDDLNEQKLNNLKEIGIKRLSIGVQSFNDDELKFMNHSLHDKCKKLESNKHIILF